MDEPSFRLLPLLWHNRLEAAVEASQLALLKGCYRRSLWLTHVTLAGGMTALDELERAGIPTLLLKGTALLAGFPGRLGVRPIEDVDILVPRPAARRAAEILEDQGWRSTHGIPRAIGVWHGIDLVRGEKERIDLHWSATTIPGNDRAIWRDAHAAAVAGRSVRVPSPAAQLLITCVHGVGPSPAPVRWIADALLLLDGESEINWGHLVSEAHRRRVTISLTGALRRLRWQFDAPIPGWVLRELGGRPARITERLAHQVAGGHGRGAEYPVELHRYVCLRAMKDPDRAPTFVDHCARRWGFESSRSLFGAALLRAGQLASRGRAEPWEVLARRARSR